MLIFKLFGAFFIIFSGIYAYLQIEKRESRRLSQLNALIDLIEHAKNQIECFLSPSEKILSTFLGESRRALGISDEMRLLTLDQIITQGNLIIDGEALETFKSFARDFGTSYRHEQIASCNYYKNELIKIRDRFKAKREQKRRVHLAICLSVTLSVIILLF